MKTKMSLSAEMDLTQDSVVQLCDHIHEELVKMTIANDKETLYD